jgi:hypothetical protein
VIIKMADSPARPESDHPVVAGAVGAASESGLGQHARAAYEAKLGRSLADASKQSGCVIERADRQPGKACLVGMRSLARLSARLANKRCN